MPYKAVFDLEDGTVMERPFETKKEGEDFFRSEGPVAEEQSPKEPPGPPISELTN